MSAVTDLAALSPHQRALLELRLKERRRQQAPRPVDESVALVAQPAQSGPFPLSFSQQRLWFVDQLEGRSSLYNVASAVRLTGRLVPEILRRAFGEVVRRHEVLRTTFGVVGGEPVQIIGAPGTPEDMALPLIDLGGIPAADREPLARRLAAELARQPFDLARGPLLGQSLLRLGDDDHVLVSVMHHIISDWWSLRLLVRELVALYGAFARGLPSLLPALPIQYRDFAVWQRRWLAGEVLAGELAYWRTRLAGAPDLLRLPLERARPAVQSFHGAKRSFTFPADLAGGLKALARREGSTLFVVLLTAFHVLLHHLSGQDDIVVSAPVSYRNRAESERLIGFLANTLLLRGDLAGNPSLRILLRRIHTGVMDDLAHQHLPLDRVIEELAPGRSLSYSPFLQVGINFGEDIAGGEPPGSGTAGLADLSIEAFDFAPPSAQFELNLVLYSAGQSLTGSLQYRTGLFSAARIDQWIAEYQAILAELLVDLDVDLDEICRRRAQHAAPASLPATAASALEGFVLSPQQERRWILEQEAPGSGLGAVCALEIRGSLAGGELERALGAVVARHEILRTTFQTIPGMTIGLQVVGEGAPLAWREVTFASSDRRTPDEQLDDAIETLRREPLDLASGPVLRATLVELPERRVLVLCLPALCADGTTLDLLVAELERALSTGWGGEAVLQYADVAQWQQDLRASAASVEALAVVFAGALTAALPFAAPREAPGRVGPDLRTLAIPPIPIPQALPAEAVLLNVWQTLLRRLTILAGTTDIVPGVGVPGRRLAELQAVLGPLDFHVPLVWAPGELPFTERVAATAAALAAAREEPLDQALQRLIPCGFGFGFDFADLPAGLAAGGVTLTPVRRLVQDEGFRLRLSCLRRGEGLTAVLDFDAATYERDDVRRLGEWYLALLANALAAPATGAEDLALLRPEEQRQVLAALRAPRVDWGAAATLPELFAAQARATPQAVALISAGRRWTYRELDQAVDRWAARLVARGAGPEVRIALGLERSIEMVVAILAIHRTGAAYVPLDPDFPADRRSYMLADSRAALLVTSEHLLAGLAVGPVPVLLLAAIDRDEREGEPSPPPSVGPISPDSLAYVIYTSGSTGKPKGVMVSHRAIANRILWMRQEFPLTADDTVLLKTPYSFDASIWEIFLPLVSGARLALAEPGGHRDPAYLLSALAEHRVTTLQLVPSQLAMLLETRDLSVQGGSLARLFCGGEALPGELVRRFASSLPAAVCNLYGPTEAAIDATFHRCAPETPAPIVPIGRPLSNVSVHVLDRRLQLVPEGLAGELYIGGDGLARGYLGRPELTAEHFVPNPWSDRPGERLYRTGDLVRHRPDDGSCGGGLEFLGRADGQVKIRGFRMELGEIEAALASHPEIAAAAVVARAAGPAEDLGAGERRLVAYYQPKATKAPAPRELREFLLRGLPEPMVPTVYVSLATLPSTPSGKVDRNALPEPGRNAHLPVEFIAPRTAVEQALAQIWESLLGIERVGTSDNFFDLGGHSLQSMRLVSHVREALGVELRVRSIFEHPTLAGLAQVVTGEMVQQLGEDLVAQLLATGSSASAAAGGESA